MHCIPFISLYLMLSLDSNNEEYVLFKKYSKKKFFFHKFILYVISLSGSPALIVLHCCLCCWWWWLSLFLLWKMKKTLRFKFLPFFTRCSYCCRLLYIRKYARMLVRFCEEILFWFEKRNFILLLNKLNVQQTFFVHSFQDWEK